MTDLLFARMAKLRHTKSCPVCGAASYKDASSDTNAIMMYVCGAIFASQAGGPIVTTSACPGPSSVAARALNGEVFAACQSQAKAGAA